MPTRFAAWAAAILLSLAAPLVLSAPSEATPLAGSSYDSSDGDQTSSATTKDWQDDQSKVTEIADELDPTPDVCFGGSIKEDTPRDWFSKTTAGGCDPAKPDLFAVWSCPEMTSATSFLHLAFKRNATTSRGFCIA